MNTNLNMKTKSNNDRKISIYERECKEMKIRKFCSRFRFRFVKNFLESSAQRRVKN